MLLLQYEKNSGSVFLGRDYTNSQRSFSSEVGKEIDREVRRIIDECYEKARQIITENRETVQLIAQTLLIHETLTNEQIVHLVEKGYLPVYAPAETIFSTVEKEKLKLLLSFSKPKIKDFNRITIGTREQMEILIQKIKEILEEKK